MRLLFALVLLGIVPYTAPAAERMEGGDRQAAGRPGKFAGIQDDPVLQALGALEDARLRDEIADSAHAYYSSRFADAHARIAGIMAKYPESAIGDVLYDFLLLMDGASLGFSGKYTSAVDVLNRLQARIEGGNPDFGPDNLAGVMALKIDFLEAGSETASAVDEMDTLIARFGGHDQPAVRWHVESAMQRKALLLERSGNREQALMAHRAYVERLRSTGETDTGAWQRLKSARRKQEELERESGKAGREPENGDVK